MYILNQLPQFINKFNNNNILNSNGEQVNNLKKIFNQSRQDQQLHRLVNYLIKNGSNDKGMRMTAHILE